MSIISYIKSLFFRRHKYYISICCIQKDENEYLLEWIDYHQKIGVEHFFIYNNNSTTPPNEILAPLIRQKKVTLIDFPGSCMQNRAYMNCVKKYGKESNWIAFIDIDEFIVPKESNGNLKKILEDYDCYGGLGINWLIFGSNNHKKKQKGLQLENFILRSKEDFIVNQPIKSIVHPKDVENILTPHSFTFKKGKYCVNENFQEIENAFSPHSSQRIQLNHYYCRSEEEYKEKVIRGNADVKDKRDLAQFYAHNKDSNIIEDFNALELYRRLSKSKINKIDVQS